MHNMGMDRQKKRVLYFIPEFPRISETFIEREVSTLIRWDNLDIKVLSLAKASGSTTEDVAQRVFYSRLNFWTFIAGLTYLLTKPAEVAKNYKVVRTKGLYFFLKSLGYTKIISRYNPQHIHVHFLSWPSTTVMVASRILGIPFSISAHARDVFVEGEFINEKIDAAKFIAVCNTYARNKAIEIAGKNADASKIKLIYHGIDPKIFEGASKLPAWNIPEIFLGGTRLVEKKGIKYVIEASKILKEQGIKHRVDLVGPGDLYNELEKLVEKLRLRDTVYIHGQGKGTPFKEVVEYYKNAGIFVLPSIETGSGDADGVPTVVIEAALAKLPVISTNAGGITDLIEDGITGIIVPQRDARAIANSINQLLTNKSLAEKLATNAYSKAETMFNIKRNIGQLEALML